MSAGDKYRSGHWWPLVRYSPKKQGRSGAISTGCQAFTIMTCQLPNLVIEGQAQFNKHLFVQIVDS
jgi:hypothetical protein